MAGCTVSDLVHYGGQSRISLVIGVPDRTNLRVYDGYSGEFSEPFVLLPQLLALSATHCQKVELQERTSQSDFPVGYLIESDGGLKKLFPNYGRRDLGHQWVYWRLFQGDEVCLLELSPDRLFVTRDDLLVLMGEGDEPPVSPPIAKKQKKPRASAGEFVDTPVTGLGCAPDAEVVDKVAAGGHDKPVVAESQKAVEAEVKKLTEPVEAASKPSPRGPTILRLKQVMERTGLARSTVYDFSSQSSPRYDATFPPRIKIGVAAVGWSADAIDAWVLARIAGPC